MSESFPYHMFGSHFRTLMGKDAPPFFVRKALKAQRKVRRQDVATSPTCCFSMGNDIKCYTYAACSVLEPKF